MKNLFALLMLGFMLILVAPVQAMQSGNDCNYSYNIDNANAPPGDAIFAITSTNEVSYFIESNLVAMYPESPVSAIIKNFLPCQHEATSRSWLSLTSENVNFSYLSSDVTSTGKTPYRMPRDGLTDLTRNISRT